MLIVLAFITTACVHNQNAVGEAMVDPAADCDMAQAWLLSQPVKKGQLTPTFSGRCRHDLQFENVPRPADVVAELENNRGYLEHCVVGEGIERYQASITIVVGKWDFGRNGTNGVSVNNSSLDEHFGDKFTGHSVSGGINGGSVVLCLINTLQRAEFPAPRLAVKSDAGTYLVAVGDKVPYTVTWHFNYPADFETILDAPPKPPTPQVFPGIGSQSDN